LGLADVHQIIVPDLQVFMLVLELIELVHLFLCIVLEAG
jgi:hypothetical protein